MIEIKNLTKSYIHKGRRNYVFKNLSFKINTGESVALIGGNGAGKSTLLRIIGGMDFPDSGEVFTDKRISWPVGLKGGFQGSLSARENTRFVSMIFHGNDKEKIQEKINYVEDFADIGKYFDKPFKKYSDGMRSRVTFALSMAFDFDIYLIDEVSAAGDFIFREKCAKILKKKLKNSDFLMVNHNLWSLKPLCHKAFILFNGEIIQFDSVKEAIKEHKRLLRLKTSNRRSKVRKLAKVDTNKRKTI